MVISELKRYFESGNVNFLIGAGASSKAIKSLYNFEDEIMEIIFRYRKTNNIQDLQEIVSNINIFLNQSIIPNKLLILRNGRRKKYFSKIKDNLSEYKEFIEIIHSILLYRASDKLPKKVNIFTTNYDLFLETACEDLLVPYNDGGEGIINRYFGSKNFQKRLFQMSDSYSYEYESPILNIVKLHGSINWLLESNDNIKIEKEVKLELLKKEDIDIEGYIKQGTNLPIILPTKQKFVRTLMEHTYYDLARYYSNELERNHSILFCFAFSFNDEHILSLTKRALGNPSLTLIIFPYSNKDEEKMLETFKMFPNAKIVRVNKCEDKYKIIYLRERDTNFKDRVNIDFDIFNFILRKVMLEVENSLSVR
jgi:hypothetical protein